MSLLFLHDDNVDDIDDGDDEIEGNDGGSAMISIWILVLFEIKYIIITLNQ